MQTITINKFSGAIAEWDAPQAYRAHWYDNEYLENGIAPEGAIPLNQGDIDLEGVYWFPLTQKQYDDRQHYDWDFDRAAATLTLTWHDDTLARIHRANELVELEDALADRVDERLALFQAIGGALDNMVAWHAAPRREKDNIMTAFRTNVTETNKLVFELHESRAAQVVEYNLFLHRLVAAYAVGLGSGRHWNDTNKARAQSVANAIAAHYWALGFVKDADGLAKKKATWLDPRSRIDAENEQPRLTRAKAMRLAELIAKGFAENHRDTHWVERKRLPDEYGDLPKTDLSDSGKTALGNTTKSIDESRRDPAKPDPISTFSVTPEPIPEGSQTTTVALRWALPDHNGAPITGVDVEYENAAPGSSPTRERRLADSTTRNFGGFVAGTWIFRVRAVNALGEGDWASDRVVIA